MRGLELDVVACCFAHAIAARIRHPKPRAQQAVGSVKAGSMTPEDRVRVLVLGARVGGGA